MAKNGEYSDMLRAIGRLLDLQGAHELEIVDDGPYLRASWQVTSGGRERRIYRAFELDRLRLESKLLRSGEAGGTAVDSLSETLRTLGAELDRKECELLSVTQSSEGFLVSMMVGGGHVSRMYTPAEVTLLRLEQRSLRRPLPGRSA